MIDEKTDFIEDDKEELTAPIDEAEEGGDDQPSGKPDFLPRKHRYSTAHELLVEGVRERAHHAPPRLRSVLGGDVLVEIEGTQKRYLFDWSTEEVQSGPTDKSEASCIVRVSEDNLLKIAAGDLNPQVAMLGEKIHVRGKEGLAIYFFNLIAPLANN